jgi:hypothetical protein
MYSVQSHPPSPVIPSVLPHLLTANGGALALHATCDIEEIMFHQKVFPHRVPKQNLIDERP